MSIALACAALPAAAADNELAGFEITPLAGYRFGGDFDLRDSDGSYEVADSSTFGLILNLRDKANTQWEVIYSQQASDAVFNGATALQPRVDTDIRMLQIGGTYLGPGELARPYLAATIGGTRIETDFASDAFFSGSIGVGLQILPESRVGIRLEARAYGTLTDSDSRIFCGTGPDDNFCAVRVDGDVLGQFETFAGVVFRF